MLERTDQSQCGRFFRSAAPGDSWSRPEFSAKKPAETALRFHKSLPEYRETPLISLSHLSRELGVGGIYVRMRAAGSDSTPLKGWAAHTLCFAFCAGVWGWILRKRTLELFRRRRSESAYRRSPLQRPPTEITGRAFPGQRSCSGCSARVFMPKGVLLRRGHRRFGKPARRKWEITDENYDGAVKMARKKSEEQGWILIQDTSLEGYEEIPLRIIQGYLTMASEAAGQLKSEKKLHSCLSSGRRRGYGRRRQRPIWRKNTGRVRRYFASWSRKRRTVFLSAERADGEICSVEGNPDTIHGRSQLRYALRGYLADSPGSAGILFLLSRLRVSSRHAALRPSSERRSEDHFRRIRRGDRWPNGSASEKRS